MLQFGQYAAREPEILALDDWLLHNMHCVPCFLRILTLSWPEPRRLLRRLYPQGSEWPIACSVPSTDEHASPDIFVLSGPV